MQHIGVGPRSSEVVIHNGIAFFAITPERPYDANLPAEEQAKQTLARLDARLAKIGSSKSQVMFITIMLADMASYDAVNAVWDAWIDPAHPPARACFQAKLANPAMKVEMIVQAGIPG